MLKRLLFLSLLCLPVSAFALQDFLEQWQLIYPDSNSDDIGGNGCQVCHINPTGNPPWNSYGATVRDIYYSSQFDIVEAIETAANFNVDDDPLNVRSEDEINRDFQPGWTEGPNNSSYIVDVNDPESTVVDETGLIPPVLPATTALDFPSPITNPFADINTGSIAIQLNEIAANFSSPVKAVTAPGINGSLFVVEKTGKIFRVELATGDKTLFLDVSNDLVTISSNSDERGLLGLAFHPNFSSNGRFYTFQSEPNRAFQDIEVDFSTIAPSSPNHRSFIVEYRASDPSCNSFIRKIQNLLIIDQPQGNHNGGDLAFDQDGHLYISLGDGGSAHDRGSGHGARGNGRNNTNPLGAILRIDVDGSNSDNGKYGIPNDNPFIDNGDPGVDEIFAYGLRNPYRMSFDAVTNDLYVGDVGQGDIEEINLVNNGDNLGWNWQEGSFAFYFSLTTGGYISDVAPPGLPNDLVAPLAQYDHDDGFSAIGGNVYRGAQVPVLDGRYVFADYNRRLFYLDAGNNILEFQSGLGNIDFVSGFGQDADNELYVVTTDISDNSGENGTLFKITASGDSNNSFPDPGQELAQCPPPNEEFCTTVKAANGNVALICL